MVDIYGEMPYTEAMGASLTPRYDDGKTIYLGIIGEVEEAIQLFGQEQASGAPELSVGDSWNNGDVAKWTKMAYLLKARLLNHMSKKANGSYKEGKYDTAEILACLDKAMQSNADNTVITHYDMAENTNDVLLADPVQTSPAFDNAGMGGGATTRPTQWLVEILTNFNGVGVEDPRADKILPWLQTNYTEGAPKAIDPNDPSKTLTLVYDGNIHMVCGRLICSVYSRTAWRQCRGSGNCIYTRFSRAFSSHKAMGREVHQFQDSEDKRGQSGRRKSCAHRGC